jgi:hypothetical protein
MYSPAHDPFDPDQLRLNGAVAGNAAPPIGCRKPPRHRQGEWFLRGPIPWAWLQRAAELPGKALALSLVLWREAGRRRRRTVRLCLNRTGLGLNRWTARRALQRLAAARLVTVDRRPGRALEVTLLDVNPEG